MVIAMAENQDQQSTTSEKMTRDAIALLNDIIAPRSKVFKFRTGSASEVLLVDTKSNKVIMLIPVSTVMQMTYDQLMKL